MRFKKSIFPAAIICCCLPSFSQQKDTTILIVPCKTGQVIIDGIVKGIYKPNEVYSSQVSYGEHLIELKTTKEKITNTVKIEKGMSPGAINIGCNETDTRTILAIDKTITLVNPFFTTTESYYTNLDNGDVLKINCSVLSKKGNATLVITRFDTGDEIYKKENFREIKDEMVMIPAKGIYSLLVYTNALVEKEAYLLAERIPSQTSDTNFKSIVRFKNDTIALPVLKTSVRVHSVNSQQPRTTVKIKLPSNTSYWVFWIGVGEKAEESMEDFTTTVPRNSDGSFPDPVFLYGMNRIPDLPRLRATSTVSYRFADAQNARLFLQDAKYQYLPLKRGDNVLTDYARVNGYTKDLNFCFWNESSLNGHDVEIRVMAFSVSSRMVVE